MAPEISPDKFLTHEAEIYLQIGRLLKKERPQEIQDKVMQMLNLDISLEEIIKKIKEMDNIEGLKARVSGPANEGGTETFQRKKYIVQAATVQKNIRGIKVPRKKLNFFKYLFTEWLNIRRFSLKTPIIRSGFFKFKIDMKRAQWESIQKDASLILHYLRFILENGWMILSKHEYNRLVLLKKLCDEISACNMTYFHDDEYVLGKIAPVEMYFLACHYRQDYSNKILDSLIFVLKYFKRSEDKIHSVSFFVNKLLFQTRDVYSLYNLILAVNMVNYRKYIGLYDLIQELPGGVISNYDFDCDGNTRPKIAAFISEKEMRLEQLMEEKREMNKVGLLIKQNADQKTEGRGFEEYDALIRFYEAETGMDKPKFLIDKDNLYLFGGNFIKRFLGEFEIFLNGRFKIEKWGEIQPFTVEFFAGDIGRMQSLLKAFNGKNLAFLRFNHARLAEIKRSQNFGTASSEEIEIVRFIDEISALILEIGKKIGHLSIACRTDPFGPDQEKVFKPMDLSYLSKSPITIPFCDKNILLPGFLYEKKFSEALLTITALCYDAGRFLQNEEIVSYRQKELKMDEEILKIKQTLERVADPVVFERIRKVYRLWQ